MTHDELLAEIDSVEIAWQVDGMNALRAVVELHKPYETTPPWAYQKYLACSVCENYTNDGRYYSEYPCPTIQAIEAELK
jgi:hypothetical protein